ncbi:unnamed protein product [Mesocestoides corti]|uniref:Fibronectin type-III domain-containing protein n=1 Tax=Mesocestoides corti TaxID=53468 RepID=A0A3P6GIC5_MESCO|nr:unnamed protein product [Mesocestoides corti]
MDAALSHRSGDCPPTTPIGRVQDSGGNDEWMLLHEEGASMAVCTLDHDCPEGKKCCSGTCQQPAFSDNIPKHVLPPQITEESKPRAFELTWNVANENKGSIEEPIIYVLQVRTFFGPEFDPMTSDTWKTLTMTTIPGARLSEPDVGWWYQYRIAAVNRFGSRGFGDSTTPPVHLTSQLPRAASAPRQLADGVWRFYADGGVDVRIDWKPPATAVIPVTEYRISWAPETPSSDNRAVFGEKATAFLHIVPATQTHYVLQDLKTNMSYNIQVQAISSWGSKIFTSSAASHFITTPGLPKREIHYRNQPWLADTSDNNIDYGELICSIVLERLRGIGLSRVVVVVHVCIMLLRSSLIVSNFHQGDARVSCSCDKVRPRDDNNRLHIASSFRALRFSQSPGRLLTIRFANDPGVFDGQFLKTMLTVNEFSENATAPLPTGTIRLRLNTKQEHPNKKLSPRLLTIQWKQLACIETGAQMSKTFMPLKPLDKSGSASTPSEESRFMVLEPVQHGDPVVPPDGQLIRKGRVEISSLQLNCHYSLFVAPHKRKSSDAQSQEPTAQPSIPIGCLCTPACFDDQSMAWASHFSCSNQVSDALPPPTNLRYQLISETLVYNMSWGPPFSLRHPRSPRLDTHPELNLSDLFYRVTWGPAMDKHLTPHTLTLMADPHPRLSPTESQTKVLPNDETSFLLDSLQPNSVYIFKIQSILVRPHRRIGSHQESSLPQILQASRESFLYIQTPTLTIAVSPHGGSAAYKPSVYLEFLISKTLYLCVPC